MVNADGFRRRIIRQLRLNFGVSGRFCRHHAAGGNRHGAGVFYRPGNSGVIQYGYDIGILRIADTKASLRCLIGFHAVYKSVQLNKEMERICCGTIEDGAVAKVVCLGEFLCRQLKCACDMLVRRLFAACGVAAGAKALYPRDDSVIFKAAYTNCGEISA